MVKIPKKSNLGIILVVIIAALFIYYSRLPSQAIVGADYYIEDDFSVVSPALDDENRLNNNYCNIQDIPGTGKVIECKDSRWSADLTITQCPNNPSLFVHASDTLYLVGGSKAASAKYLKNLKNYDLQIKADGNGDIFLGDNLIRISGDTLVEIKKGSNPDDYFVYKNGELAQKFLIASETAYLTFSSDKGDCNSGGGELRISYFKSRPYYNCEVENDEILVRDRFKDGSFSIQDLTYEPLKFCPETYPVVQRNFEEQGVRADINNEVFNKLFEGETIIVPKDTWIEVFYITDYSFGMGEKCGIDSYYDLDDNVCRQGIFEAEDIIKIVRDTRFVEVGNNQKLVKNAVVIGENTLQAHKPEFMCDKSQNWNSPQPQENCWKSLITYKGEEYILNTESELRLDNCIPNLKLYIDAHFDKDKATVDDYTNNMLLTINKSCLSASAIQDDEYYAIFGDDRQMKFRLENEFANFASYQAGYRLVKSTDLLTRQTSELVQKDLPIGTTDVSIPIDTSGYGEHYYRVLPYFKVGDEIFYSENEVIYNYDVVDEIPGNVRIVEVNNTKVIYSTKTVAGDGRIPLWMIIVGIAVLLLILLRLKK